MRWNVPYILVCLGAALCFSLTTPNLVLADKSARQTADQEKPPPVIFPGPSVKGYRYHLTEGIGEALLINLATAPVYWWWMTFLHEASHALVATACGGHVTAFKIYPHVTPDGNFRFAGFYFDGQMTDRQTAAILAAPLVMDTLWFTASDLVLTYRISPGDLSGTPYLFAGLVCPLIDFLVNINGQDPRNDTSRIAALTGTPKWAWMLVGNSIAAVGVWRVIHHGWRLFVDREPIYQDQPRFTVAPIASSGMVGLSLQGTF